MRTRPSPIARLRPSGFRGRDQAASTLRPARGLVAAAEALRRLGAGAEDRLVSGFRILVGGLRPARLAETRLFA